MDFYRGDNFNMGTQVKPAEMAYIIGSINVKKFGPKIEKDFLKNLQN